MLVALGVLGASALEEPFATCLRPAGGARKFGVDTEDFKFFADLLKLLMLLEGERKGTPWDGELVFRLIAGGGAGCCRGSRADDDGFISWEFCRWPVGGIAEAYG